MSSNIASWTGRTSVIACALAAALSLSVQAAETDVKVEVLPLVQSRSLVLDITEAASRGVMVGERGHVLVSESRTEWRQVENVPTRATLTAVASVGDIAWAVGHDGTVIKSTDGGLNWTLKRSDRAGATPAEGAAEGEAEWNPRAGAPLLDVAFFDENTGIAIGAFSLMLRTTDGGESWQPILINPASAEPAAAEAEEAEGDGWTFDDSDLELQEEEDPHLNSIVRTPSGVLLVVGERGSAYRSRDAGESWERLQLPYGGSMFGAIALGDEHLVAFGLRGHVLEARDGGSSWTELDTGTELSLMGGAALEGGGFVVVGANGVILRREQAGSAIELNTFTNANQETPVLAAVLPRGTRTFLVCGERGVGQHQMTN